MKKNGTASYNKQQLRKLKLMVLASLEVDRCTNNKMTKAQKLKAAFRRAVQITKIELYGGMNYNVTGSGIPRYKGNRLYVKKI